MGTYYTHGATRADIIREITAPWTNESGAFTTLRKAFSGNTMWTVQDTPAGPFIGCYLLQRSASGWGYKPMDESMGPCEVSCPLAFLDMVPDPGYYATSWRVRVRAYHAARNARLATNRAVRKALVLFPNMAKRYASVSCEHGHAWQRLSRLGVTEAQVGAHFWCNKCGAKSHE